MVGGGLAGLMTVIKLCEAGHKVDLLSIVPVKRSHSVCAQGGINGAVNTKGEGDHPDIHFKDTLAAATSSPSRRRVKGMCYAAPGIIYLLDRMGVPFNRTPEGLLDFRRFGGTLHHRTAFAGATTGQQLLYALDEQVRRYEADGQGRQVRVLGVARRRCRTRPGAAAGIVAMDLRTMEIRAFPAEAVMPRHRRPGHRLRPLHQLDHQHRHRRRPRVYHARARSTPTASSSRCTRPPSPARTSCG